MNSQVMFELIFGQMKYWCSERAAADMIGDEQKQFGTLVSVVALVQLAERVFEAQPEQMPDHGIGEHELLDLYRHARSLLGPRHSVCMCIGTFCLATARTLGGPELVLAIARQM